MAKFNYRRGLLRVYVVLSVLWVALAVAITIKELPRWANTTDRAFTPPPLSSYEGPAPGPPPGYTLDRKPSPSPNGKSGAIDYTDAGFWMNHIAIAVLPPTIGYAALFVVLPWIVRGFRSE